jgi:hypothetical protein
MAKAFIPSAGNYSVLTNFLRLKNVVFLSYRSRPNSFMVIFLPS